IAEICWHTLDDAAGFSVQNALRACACSAPCFLCDEADRVRFKLQPVLSLWCICQFWISKEAPLGQDLVIVTHKRAVVSKRHLAFLQTLHKPSHPRSPILPYTSDTLDHWWLRTLPKPTIRPKSSLY